MATRAQPLASWNATHASRGPSSYVRGKPAPPSSQLRQALPPRSTTTRRARADARASRAASSAALPRATLGRFLALAPFDAVDAGLRGSSSLQSSSRPLQRRAPPPARLRDRSRAEGLGRTPHMLFRLTTGAAAASAIWSAMARSSFAWASVRGARGAGFGLARWRNVRASASAWPTSPGARFQTLLRPSRRAGSRAKVSPAAPAAAVCCRDSPDGRNAGRSFAGMLQACGASTTTGTGSLSHSASDGAPWEETVLSRAIATSTNSSTT